jgi:Protein of unknown function, DUF547
VERIQQTSRRWNDYLKQFAENPQAPASGNDAAASLINLYNVITIRWILANYPTESIMALKGSFKAKRHDIGGHKASLDDVEKCAPRPLLGYRAHAVLVCAARRCSALPTTPSQLDEQIDGAYRSWFARDELNRFLPDHEKPKSPTSSIGSKTTSIKREG